MAAQRIGACSRSHVISGDQQQVGNRGGGIRTHAVLRDAHCPKNADAIGLHDHVGDLFQQFDGEAAGLRRKLHRERLEALPVVLEAVDPLGEKILFLQAIVQDVARDGAKPHEVSSRLWLKEEIGAFRHLMLAQIGDDQLLPAQLVGPLDAGGQDRMGLRRIAADDEDEPGVLDVPDRSGIAAVTNGPE